MATLLLSMPKELPKEDSFPKVSPGPAKDTEAIISIPPAPEPSNQIVDKPVDTAATLKDKILKLLVAGVRPGIVAQSLGCDPSYISQLASQPEFLEKILESRNQQIQKELNVKEKYEKLENSILTKLTNLLPQLNKPMELSRVLQVVQAKKFQATDIPTQEPQRATVVNLTLNKKVSQKFILNGNKDIIGIGDKSFAPMATANLLEVAKAPEAITSIEHNHKQHYTDNEVDM